MNELKHDIDCDRSFIHGLTVGWNLALSNDENKQFVLNEMIESMLNEILAERKVFNND